MKKTPSHRKYSQALAATLLTAMLASNSAHAANDIWIGNTDANFGTLGNWTGSVTPNGNTPEFGVAGTAGTTLNNDISSASYTGFQFNSGASAYTIGGNAFTLSGGITNSSGSLQTINNAIALSTATHAITATSGNIALGGAFSAATGSGSVTFSGPGTTTLSGTNTFNLNQGNFGQFFVGASAAAPGNVSITGATTLNSTGTSSTNGGQLTILGDSTLTIQTGGSLLIDSVISAGGGSIIGHNATGTSTLLVNGGSLTVNGAQGFVLGNNVATATGVLTISLGTATINRGSTTVTDARSYISIGKDLGNGTINLNGGTLATDRNFVRDGGSSTGNGGTANFVFGGGTLKALADQSDWLKSTTTNTYLQALSSVTTTAVSTIDSNGFTVAINNNISGAGGFNIISSTGTGTVKFGGVNTYTGPTTVTSGTLTLGANAAVATFLADSSNLFLTTGSFLNLSFTSNAVMESISGLFIDGQQQSAGTWGAVGSGANFESSLITGTGFLNVTSAVPEPSTYAALAGVLALGAVITRRRNRQA